jgi:Tfp pilus assembly protein PilF
MMQRKVRMALVIGAALAVGCTKRVELERSPFITPLPEGKRPANAAPAETPAAGPADSSGTPVAVSPAEPGLTAEQLAELKDEDGKVKLRPARSGDADTPAVTDARAQAAGDPKSAEAQLGLARAYHRERIYDLALRHYEEARSLDPRNPEIGREMGRLWVDAGAPELGLPYLEEACRTTPDDDLAWSYRGIALDLLKRYPEAEDALRKAVALDSRRWDYLNNLGWNLLLQERYAQAADEFARGLSLAPDEPALLNNLGLAAGYQGLPDSALAVFRRAGAEAQAWNNVGLVHRFRGETEAEALAFERAAALDPVSREIAGNLRDARRRLSDERALQAISAPAAGPEPTVPAGASGEAAPAGGAAVPHTAQPAKVGARREPPPAADPSNLRPQGPQ